MAQGISRGTDQIKAKQINITLGITKFCSETILRKLSRYSKRKLIHKILDKLHNLHDRSIISRISMIMKGSEERKIKHNHL